MNTDLYPIDNEELRFAGYACVSHSTFSMIYLLKSVNADEGSEYRKQP